MLDNYKFKFENRLFCVLLIIFILIIAFTFYKVARDGIPNEFTYNIPFIHHVQGKMPDSVLLDYSKRFANPFLRLISETFSSKVVIYYTVTITNILLFVIGAFLIYQKRCLAISYVLIFFVLSGKLLTTGISSSFLYATLLIGIGLIGRNKIRALYIVMSVLFFIYPIGSGIILLIYSITSLLDKRPKETFKTILVLLTLVTFFFLSKDIFNQLDHDTNYLGWSKILNDPYFFSDSMVPIAATNNFVSILSAILLDSNKIGTTLFSLQPFETPRYLGWIIIIFGFVLNRTQNTEHRTQNTEHRTQNTEHRTQNTISF